MEPVKKTENKKVYTSFVPVRRAAQGLEFYLQKRDMTPVNNPGLFAEFGGRVENGEELVPSLERELQEELCYKPERAVYFSKYELPNSIVHVFYEVVGNDFESKVKVIEGEYGKFLLRSEIENSHKVSLLSQIIVQSLDKYLKQ